MKKREVSKFQAIVVAVASVFLFGGGLITGKLASKVTQETYFACVSDPEQELLNTIYQYKIMGIPKQTIIMSVEEEVKDPEVAKHIKEQIEKVYSAKEDQIVPLDHFIGCLNK